MQKDYQALEKGNYPTFIHTSINTNLSKDNQKQDDQADAKEQKSQEPSSVQKLTTNAAAMSFVSNMVGGAIASIPYAFSSVGVALGISIHLIIMAIYMLSVIIYIKVKTNLGFDSLSELGFACFGRSSVFLINILTLICSCGIVALYVNLFAAIGVSLMPTFNNFWSFLNSIYFYGILLAVIVLPLLVKKKLNKLKIASYIQLFGIASVILMFLYKLISGQSEKSDSSSDQPITFSSIVDSVNIIMTGYGYTLCLFPVYAELKTKTRKSILIASAKTEIFAFGVYILFSFLAYSYYGNAIEQSIFDNLKTDSGVASIIVRVMFMLLLLSSVAYLFMTAKDTFVTVYLEIKQKETSRMMHRQIMKNSEAKEKFIDLLEDDSSFDDEQQQNNNNQTQKKEKPILDKVSKKFHFLTIAILLAFTVTLGLLITDISIFFGIIAAVALSFINFIIPGMLYIKSQKVIKEKISTGKKVGVYAFIFVGVLYFCSSSYLMIEKLAQM